MSDRDPICGHYCKGGFCHEGVKFRALWYSYLTLKHYIK